MVPAETLASLAFFDGVPERHLRTLGAAADETTFAPGAYLVRQHGEARHVFVLLEGDVVFLVRFEGVADLLVGATSTPGALIGWSTFRAPYRYTASVRSEGTTRAIHLPRVSFDAVLYADPATGCLLMRRVVTAVAERLEQVRDLLLMEGEDVPPVAGDLP